MRENRQDERLRLNERLREWLNSPEERELRERARGLGVKIDLSAPPARKQQRLKLGRRKGAGRPQSLRPEQIARAQEILRSQLKEFPTLKKHSAALVHLKPLLKLDVSDATLLRHVIRPVLSIKNSSAIQN